MDMMWNMFHLAEVPRDNQDEHPSIIDAACGPFSICLGLIGTWRQGKGVSVEKGPAKLSCRPVRKRSKAHGFNSCISLPSHIL
jgi:hypothetical protein